MIRNTILTEELGNGAWRTSDGVVVYEMGGIARHTGEHVWTDGKIVYGYALPGVPVVVPKRKKVDNSGIIFASYPDIKSIFDTEWVCEYTKTKGSQSERARGYEVNSEVTKSPAWSKCLNQYSCAVVAGKLLLYYESGGVGYVADNQGNSVALTGSDERPAFLDGSAVGRSAWYASDRIFVLNADLSIHRIFNMNTIAYNIARAEEYDDGEGNSLKFDDEYCINRYVWRSYNTVTLTDIRFLGENFCCSFGVEMTGTETKEGVSQSVTYRDQVFINGDNADISGTGRQIADIHMVDGVYNGYTKKMTYTYTDEQDVEHTVTLTGTVDYNVRLHRIGDYLYLHRNYPYGGGIVGVLPVGGSASTSVSSTGPGTMITNVVPLQKVRDVAKFTNGWSYVEPGGA